jgi:hypothetical protein
MKFEFYIIYVKVKPAPYVNAELALNNRSPVVNSSTAIVFPASADPAGLA